MNFRFLLALMFISFVGFSQTEGSRTLRIYGHTMLDMGYNFGQSNSDWYDVMRPTQLPTFTNEYGTNGNVYMSVRQTRFGAESTLPTSIGPLKILFEFELFGVGSDAGKTTFRLRHAYGEIGKFGAGQTWSTFMDIDVFPNTLEYWGPNAMVFYRNIQLRYMPIQGPTRLTFSLEQPGSSQDLGIYGDRNELTDVYYRFPIPDLSGEFRKATSWGYVEIAGMLRYLSWEDLGDEPFDLSGSTWGWGLNLSSNYRINQNNILRGQLVFGEGVQSYIDDAGPDLGIQNNFGDSLQPIVGVALPVLGALAFIDHRWSENFTSAFGFGLVNIDNSDAQSPTSFKQGRYGIINLLYYPVPEVQIGTEIQYGGRTNFSDGWSYNTVKWQLSFKYTFNQPLKT